MEFAEFLLKNHGPARIRGLGHSLAWVLLFFAFSTTVTAQQIGSGISTKEAFVDSRIVFQIKIAASGNGINDLVPPEPPKVDGLEITSAGSPSRSSSIRIINGRRSSSSTLTYNYIVTPKRVGTFTLPPVDVNVDGKDLSTRAHTFVVSKSETGDLLFVELESERNQAYVGEAVKLKLKIWLRGYADRKQRIQLDEQQMWQLFNRAQTEWGIFGERLNELAAERKRPAGQDVLRKDSEGVSRAYLLYEIESTMYPKRPGQIDPGNVRIVVDYPTKIGRPRSSFGGSIFGPSLIEEMMGGTSRIQASRPISVEATAPAIQIVDVPTKGRPADYRGAVGKYNLLVEADKKTLKVGESIGLRIFIKGDGPMELVEPPPLATLPELVQDFKVEDKALAGFVQDDAKAFATSIRPTNADVTEIPPIPFSFFDPIKGSFRTVYSNAIPISVEANESLSMDSIVANKRGAAVSKPVDSKRLEQDASVLTVDEMLRQSAVSRDSSPVAWMAFAVAPLVCLIGLVVSRRAEVATWWRRRKDPLYEARSRIGAADSASEIRDALSIPGVVLPDEVRSIRAECDRMTFSPDASRSHRAVEALKQRALAALAQPVLLLCLVVLMVSSSSDASEVKPMLSLSRQQAETILEEAYAAHLEAKEQTDSAVVSDRLAVAISKYELVRESGLESYALQLNLGDAHFQNGDLAKSLAAFETARRLQPSSIEMRKRIAVVREAIGGEVADTTYTFSDEFRVIPSGVYWWVGLIGWTMFWIAMLTCLFVTRLPRKILLVFAVSMLCLIGVAYAAFLRSQSGTFDVIAAVDGAELRAADGEAFEVLHVVRLGEPLVVSDRRGEWLHVSDAKSDKRGWLSANDAAVIGPRFKSR